ncbi:MAG: EAL domain-containing protein [Sphingomonadales bacterium]|nr:EAL domain-containing protein [Sphingomonadales bacterium]
MARLNIRSFMQGAPAPAPVLPVLAAGIEAQLCKSFEDSGRGWFWVVDAEGSITYVSAGFADLFATPRETLTGRKFAEFFTSESLDANPRQRLSFALSRRANFDRIAHRTDHPGEPRWWEISGRAQFDSAGEFRGFLGFGTDITERLHVSQSASQLALVDALTGLPNRLSMQQHLDEFVLALGAPGRSCAVVLLDLDRFKAVNDTLGHPAGDALLRQVSDRLRRIVGAKGKVFRLGGDEFQLLLPGWDAPDKLAELMQDVVAHVSQPYTIDGVRCVIGTSAGIAIGPRDGRSSEELIRKADFALYAAKDEGRGCHRFFAPEMLELAERRRRLEEDMRDALARGEFALHYQPGVNLASGDVASVEALLRWEHPVQGPVSPAVFIPIAEGADLIEPIGEWTLRRACMEAAAWPAPIRVAVNVSPIQFANPALPTIVISALAQSGLAPDRLELEITEGVFLGESSATDAQFAALKAIGVRLALDDFGTGYSSLGYLKTAPFDKIKIDQSFVRGATLPGSRNGAIIAAIVALADALDMETTAEGIESFDQLNLMRELGVGYIQGFIYSKALSNEDLCGQLAAGTWTIAPAGPARHRNSRRSVYRRVGVLLGNYYHPVLLRNLSETGAYIEGLFDVPAGAQLLVDFGQGRLALALVQRADARGHGIEFFDPLVEDDAGGLGPQSRVAPYLLATLGLSELGQKAEPTLWDASETLGFDALLEKLELGGSAPAASAEATPADSSHQRVKSKFAALNPLQNLALLNRGEGTRHLTRAEWERLRTAVEESGNAQLKYIIALVVLTGARFQDLLAATWDDVDSKARLWTVPATPDTAARSFRLSHAAWQVIEALPRFADVAHMIVNPRTRQPFKSVFASWDAARTKAGLASLSIHDLRNSLQKSW